MNGRPEDALRVGVLFSQTGPTAFVEQTQARATLLAIEEINAAGGVCGQTVVAVQHDAQSDPARFGELAEQLLTKDGASLIFGCYMTNTRQAIVPIVERRNALLAYPAPYEGFEYSPNVIYGGAVPNQHIVMLARYLMRNFGRRFYLVGTRYTFPIESNRVMMTVVAEQGGQVLAERYVRLDSKWREFIAIAEDIARKKPDVVFCTVVGETSRLFYEACHEVGVDKATAIASLTVTEAEVALMTPGLAEGHLTAATYFQSVDTAANRKFLAAYAARFGSHDLVNAMSETAYGLAHIVLSAVDRAGSVEPDAVRAALGLLSFDAPQGPIHMDCDNNHFFLWPRIGRLSAEGRFEIVEDSSAPIKPDPYLVHHILEDCDPSTGLDKRLA